MPVDRGIHQSQTADMESFRITRRDRNTFIVGGGDWSWDAVNGVLQWSADFEIYVGSVGSVAVPAGNITNVLVSDDVVLVYLDREVPSISGGVQSRKITDGTIFSDSAYMLAVRGQDSRLYFRDGTVFSDGETKQLGAAQAATDRVDYQSDGRPFSQAYIIGIEIASDTGNGDTDATGLQFTVTSGTPGLLSAIPNTGGVPDTLTLLEIQTAGVTDAVIPIANVDSDTELTLVSPGATPSLSGKDWVIHDHAFGYDHGTDQLAVFVEGALQVEGTHYSELFGPGISYAIQFSGAGVPALNDWVSFVDVAGGMGPSGPDVSTTLQEAYDNSSASGRRIELQTGEPVDLSGPNGPDLIITGREAAGAVQSSLSAEGVWVANEYSMPDGSGDEFRIYPNAGNLRIEHKTGAGVQNGWEMSNQGDIRPFKGATYGQNLPWVGYYSGSFANPAVPVFVNTGVTSGVYGAVLMIQEKVSGLFYLAEMNRTSLGTDTVTVSYNQATGQIVIADAITGGNPGTAFNGQDWKLLLFFVG